MSAQYSFEGLKQKEFFGGARAAGKRKGRRPIATKRAMHLVLKSSQAVGRQSFLSKQHSTFVGELVQRLSQQWNVRIFQFSNNGNHLHLLIQARDRRGFQAFVRTLSALVARRVTGARKGCKLKGPFWDGLPFTRIIAWGRAFALAKNYVLQNILEAAGKVPYHPRTSAVPWRLT
jgi:REP element-mobilizing transposase RayT